MIKYIKFFIIALLLVSCGSDELELRGTMHTIDRLGFKCWYIKTDKNVSYEIVTSKYDDALFQEGLKVYVSGRLSKKRTICDFPLVIEVRGYEFDSSQRTRPQPKISVMPY